MISPMAGAGRSYREQLDIADLLINEERFTEVFINVEAKGVPETVVDAQLAGMRVPRARGTEKPGLCIIVAQPAERPDPAQGGPLLIVRRHTIRIIEVPEVNRKSGGTQIDADTAKDWVLQTFQPFHNGRAGFVWAGNDPWADEKGGYGWEVKLDVRDTLESKQRSATPLITVAADVCTLTGAGTAGEVLYYTLDGSAPVPANATQYTAPFPVDRDQLIRVASTSDGRELSFFKQSSYDARKGAWV